MRETATVKEACEQTSDRRAGSVLVADAKGALVGTAIAARIAKETPP
jgi:hypothetical protein